MKSHDSILSQLYRGDLRACTPIQPDNIQGQKSQHQALQEYTGFMLKLPDELRDEFRCLVDQLISADTAESEQAFIEGFRLGVRLMGEVYRDGEDGERGLACLRTLFGEKK